jgi:hypothetical protein
MTEKKNKQTASEFETKDPIGEIKAYAVQLWEKDGRPAGKTWESYRAEAEELLLAGKRSASVPSSRKREKQETKVDPYFSKLASQTSNTALSILAAAFQKPLNFHEGVCLSIVLSNNQVLLTDSTKFGPLADSDIANILAELSFDYPPELVVEIIDGDFRTIPFKKRCDYWESAISVSNNAEKVLNFNDLNTIKRLEASLCAEPRVVSLSYQGVTSLDAEG